MWWSEYAGGRKGRNVTETRWSEWRRCVYVCVFRGSVGSRREVAGKGR
jgi:hypothetical protein